MTEIQYIEDNLSSDDICNFTDKIREKKSNRRLNRRLNRRSNGFNFKKNDKIITIYPTNDIKSYSDNSSDNSSDSDVDKPLVTLETLNQVCLENQIEKYKIFKYQFVKEKNIFLRNNKKYMNEIYEYFVLYYNESDCKRFYSDIKHNIRIFTKESKDFNHCKLNHFQNQLGNSSNKLEENLQIVKFNTFRLMNELDFLRIRNEYLEQILFNIENNINDNINNSIEMKDF